MKDTRIIAGVPVTLRSSTENDLRFLLEVYASTRQEEMSIVPWTDEQKREFLEMQFRAQHEHYRQFFPRAVYWIIERAGAPIGRLYLDRRKNEIRIIDIALLPQQRGRGIGGELLREILDEASASGLPVRIHVERNNSAMTLYRRLGFQLLEDKGVYQLMEYSAERSAS